MTKYCQVESVKDQTVGIAYQDFGFDEESKYEVFIASLIDRASRFVDRTCNRPDDFFNGGASITELQDGKPYLKSSIGYGDTDRALDWEAYRRTYYLQHAPVLSTPAPVVSKNTAGIGETDAWTTLTKFRLNTTTGKLVFSTGEAPVEGTDNVKFVYTAGYTTLLVDIQYACEELVVNQLKLFLQQGMAARVRLAQPTLINFSSSKIMTPSVEERLAPYKKRRMF
jgi:hypothetical protein